MATIEEKIAAMHAALADGQQPTLEQINAMIAMLSQALVDGVVLPDSGSVGATSYSGLKGTINTTADMLDHWKRMKLAYYNGGLALRTRRCC